jgi:hypothetical protein
MRESKNDGRTRTRVDICLRVCGAIGLDLERFLAECDVERGSTASAKGSDGASSSSSSSSSGRSSTRDAVIARADELARKLNVSELVADLGKRCYYRLLADICRSEERRLKERAREQLRCLLRDKRMHAALLAMSFEMILHVHAPLARPFPAVLRAMQVSSPSASRSSISYLSSSRDDAALSLKLLLLLLLPLSAPCLPSLLPCCSACLTRVQSWCLCVFLVSKLSLAWPCVRACVRVVCMPCNLLRLLRLGGGRKDRCRSLSCLS